MKYSLKSKRLIVHIVKFVLIDIFEIVEIIEIFEIAFEFEIVFQVNLLIVFFEFVEVILMILNNKFENASTISHEHFVFRVVFSDNEIL